MISRALNRWQASAAEFIEPVVEKLHSWIFCTFTQKTFYFFHTLSNQSYKAAREIIFWSSQNFSPKIGSDNIPLF